MPRCSSGLLVFRLARSSSGGEELEVLAVHPGGPLWAKKDAGAWSIPKGEHATEDDALECAKREFEVELGVAVPEGPLLDLGEVVQRGGKRIRAWALEGDVDIEKISSNEFEMQWPPRSGNVRSFPEVDRAAWFSAQEAMEKLNPAQGAFVERLVGLLRGRA